MKKQYIPFFSVLSPMNYGVARIRVVRAPARMPLYNVEYEKLASHPTLPSTRSAFRGKSKS